MADEIEFWHSDQWTMVYLNGELQLAGPHYLADKWLQARFNVRCVEDDEGYCIPDGKHALESLAEVRAAMRADEERVVAAAAKRAEARRLLIEAEEIENGLSSARPMPGEARGE